MSFETVPTDRHLPRTTRRDVLKLGGALAAGSVLAGVGVPWVHAAEDNTIRLALIGCGGRGTGAAGQAFFSLSLGMGAMLTYGSYLSKTENIPVAGTTVALFDTGIAILGCGYISDMYRQSLAFPPELRLVGVCVRERSRADDATAVGTDPEPAVAVFDNRAHAVLAGPAEGCRNVRHRSRTRVEPDETMVAADPQRIAGRCSNREDRAARVHVAEVDALEGLRDRVEAVQAGAAGT